MFAHRALLFSLFVKKKKKRMKIEIVESTFYTQQEFDNCPYDIVSSFNLCTYGFERGIDSRLFFSFSPGHERTQTQRDCSQTLSLADRSTLGRICIYIYMNGRCTTPERSDKPPLAQRSLVDSPRSRRNPYHVGACCFRIFHSFTLDRVRPIESGRSPPIGGVYRRIGPRPS